MLGYKSRGDGDRAGFRASVDGGEGVRTGQGFRQRLPIIVARLEGLPVIVERLEGLAEPVERLEGLPVIVERLPSSSSAVRACRSSSSAWSPELSSKGCRAPSNAWRACRAPWAIWRACRAPSIEGRAEARARRGWGGGVIFKLNSKISVYRQFYDKTKNICMKSH